MALLDQAQLTAAVYQHLIVGMTVQMADQKHFQVCSLYLFYGSDNCIVYPCIGITKCTSSQTGQEHTFFG